MSYFRVPMDLRKAKVDHRLYQRLLNSDASKTTVVNRAIADLQFGPDDLEVHPVLV